MYNFLLKIFAVTSLLLLGACSTIGVSSSSGGKTVTTTTTTTVTTISALSSEKYDIYTVRKGDTLKKIAGKFGVATEVLVKNNNLKLTSVLNVGQKIKIPAPVKTVKSVQPPLLPHSLLWPTQGKLIRVFAATNKHGSKGIDIAGGFGQDVKASADGKVVYSGSGLSGLGNMVIIKHSERVVTVYALVKKIMVKEGQLVKTGNVIAQMGNNNRGDVLLHFEVRIDGQPRDPLLYLPKM